MIMFDRLFDTSTIPLLAKMAAFTERRHEVLTGYIANISTPDPQQILIRPFDQGIVKDVEKALRSSDLGMSPNSDGKNIRLNVPAMSGEQRQKMVARIKKSAEEAKVAARNIRRDGNKHFDLAEKEKEMTEDDCEKGKEEVQSLLKKYEDRITEMADKKSKEIMEL